MRSAYKKLFSLFCSSGLLLFSVYVNAAGFQLFEQDGASVANFHAGYAALATDASTAWYNPAGIPRIKNQQLVLAAVNVFPNLKYRDSVIVVEEPYDPEVFNNVTAQGGTFAVIPSLHYVAPLSDCLGFGFSVTIPFGLKTDYGSRTPLRYAATQTSIQVIDMSPSLGYQINPSASVGVGFDIQDAKAKFDNVGVFLLITPSDTLSTNELHGMGYGYHLGGLYQFTPYSRIGLSYHSKVVHHLSGMSRFKGILATVVNYTSPLKTNHANAKLTLPAYTALSAYHQFHPKVAFMGSVIYTQWDVLKNLRLNNFAGIITPVVYDVAGSTSIQVNVPQHFHNSWNASVGIDYLIDDQLLFRTGVGFDESPVPRKYRNVQGPDNDRYIIAIGGHYQATKTIGFDLGWAHLFFPKTHLNPPPQEMGAQMVSTPGTVSGGGDIVAAQLTWDML